MKNIKGFVFGFIAASLLITPLPVIAQEIAKTITGKENTVTLIVDKYQKKGQKVYIINNTVYVPMNSIAQLVHKKVNYDSKKNIINYSGSNGMH